MWSFICLYGKKKEIWNYQTKSSALHQHSNSKLKRFIFLAGEAERIRKCKGRVYALRDEPEVARVWLPNYDTPGLAMARAFGDFCLKGFGLISEPEVSYRHLTERDEFVVLATDGVILLLIAHSYFILGLLPSQTIHRSMFRQCFFRFMRSMLLN